MKKVTYICDGKKWCAGEEGCHLNGGGCKHTKDIRHAKNFHEWGSTYAENTAEQVPAVLLKKITFLLMLWSLLRYLRSSCRKLQRK